MGRIKTSMIKNLTKKIYLNNKPLFKEDFESNKLILNGLIKTESKKLRNIIAGYLTRLVKQEKLENT
ncbi:MAG: 30S ribosomal protein S17e [Nanoarchaeota archaeon]